MYIEYYIVFAREGKGRKGSRLHYFLTKWSLGHKMATIWHCKGVRGETTGREVENPIEIFSFLLPKSPTFVRKFPKLMTFHLTISNLRGIDTTVPKFLVLLELHAGELSNSLITFQ